MYRVESETPLLSNYYPEESLSSGYDSASEVSDVSPCECPSEKTCEARDAGEVMTYRNPHALCEDMKYILSVTELCDVTFLVGERQTPIHGLRAVLGTRSRVLYQLILEAQRNANKTRKMSPSKRMVSKLMSPKTPKTSKQTNRKLLISMPDYEAKVFQKVIRYVHCGVVRVDVTTVVGLLNAASEFGLDDLRMACWDFLDRCINAPTVLDLLKTTEKYTEKSQTEKILKLIHVYIDANADKVLRLPGFQTLSVNLVDKILSRKQLCTTNFNRMNAALRWSKRRRKQTKKSTNINDTLESLLPVIKTSEYCKPNLERRNSITSETPSTYSSMSSASNGMTSVSDEVISNMSRSSSSDFGDISNLTSDNVNFDDGIWLDNYNPDYDVISHFSQVGLIN